MRLLVADLAQRDQPEAIVSRLYLDTRPRKFAHDLRHGHVRVLRGFAEHLAVAFVRVLVLEETVQERGVRRIDADLERLQPVAIDHALEGEGVGRRARRNNRIAERPAARPAQIGEQDAALFDDRIRLEPDVGAQVAVSGSAGVCRHLPSTSNSQP